MTMCSGSAGGGGVEAVVQEKRRKARRREACLDMEREYKRQRAMRNAQRAVILREQSYRDRRIIGGGNFELL
jgi:hypothetical protein